MGRGQGRPRLLIAAAAAALCGAGVPSALPLRDSRWLQSPDPIADLTHQPAECRSSYADPKLERSAEVGRLAFRAPLLLGGQAARAGLSCSACHRNGRGNPHFHFPGISGEPGTADVTASLMSSHRGDDLFNPRPIPDLAGNPAGRKVSRDPRRDDLKRFIEGLITQEFDGPEPPPAVLDGLVAYVRSLSPDACHGTRAETIRLDALLREVDDAVRLAELTHAAGDAATARFLIGAARSTLGRIDERFALPGGEGSRKLLREADGDLKTIELEDNVTSESFARWRSRWTARARQLRAAEPRSLFSAAMLRRALTN